MTRRAMCWLRAILPICFSFCSSEGLRVKVRGLDSSARQRAEVVRIFIWDNSLICREYDLHPMKDQERSARSLEMGTARVEAFSDAVMAVIITILAFELRAPRGATLGAVRDQLPGLLV
jgi:hypothetical protein